MAYTEHLYCDTFPYITPEELLLCCPYASGMEDDDVRLTDAIDDASTVLFYLTGRQFAGTCTTTVRPSCLSGSCICGCSPNQVNLGLWPVTELISVRYGGTLYQNMEELHEVDEVFHVNEYHYLARNDGEAFQTGNQWALAGSAEDNEANGYVFEVELRHGIQIPRLLTRAARALACQFVSACCDGPCKLPERVTQVVRSGITMDIASVSDMLRHGNTGIYEVDLAIQVFNPSKLQSPSFIWNANTSYGRRIGT